MTKIKNKTILIFYIDFFKFFKKVIVTGYKKQVLQKIYIKNLILKKL